MTQISEFVVNQWMLFVALAIILGLLIRSIMSDTGSKNINPTRAIQLINHDDAVVLDVRLEDEFKEGHVLNSVHIPVGLLQNRIQELDKYKDKPIIVNCRSGQRSNSAVSVLTKQGFASVYKLQGGILAWKNANLPLTKV